MKYLRLIIKFLSSAFLGLSLEMIRSIIVIYLLLSLITTGGIFYGYIVYAPKKGQPLIETILWGNAFFCILILFIVVSYLLRGDYAIDAWKRVKKWNNAGGNTPNTEIPQQKENGQSSNI